MKKAWAFIKKYTAIVIIAILIIILFLRECSRPDCSQTSPITDTVTTHDTIPGDSIPVETFVSKPYPVYRDTGKTIIMPADTALILFTYYTENKYEIILKDDTGAFIQYNTSVWMNELQPGTLLFQNKRPYLFTTNTIVNNIIEEKKFKMFVGVSIGGSLTGFRLAPGLMFQWKGFLSGIDYDVVGNQVSIPLYYKLSFKKKNK